MKLSIGFSKPKKWKPLAWLIMAVGGTTYSHTFVTWKCTAIDRRKVFEAVGSGVRILSNVTFKDQAEIVKLYSFEVSEDRIGEIEKLAHDMAGTSYGTKALVGIAIMKIFNFFNELFKLKGRQSNPFKDGSKSNVCIEAGARMLFTALGKPIPQGIEGFDLKEYEELIHSLGKEVPQSKIDKINGKTS